MAKTASQLMCLAARWRFARLFLWWRSGDETSRSRPPALLYDDAASTTKPLTGWGLAHFSAESTLLFEKRGHGKCAWPVGSPRNLHPRRERLPHHQPDCIVRSSDARFTASLARTCRNLEPRLRTARLSTARPIPRWRIALPPNAPPRPTTRGSRCRNRPLAGRRDRTIHLGPDNAGVRQVGPRQIRPFEVCAAQVGPA